MKIAFIGTHGVGKTTLCFDLAAALKKLDLNVDIVKEVARECPLPINKETGLQSESWILHTQIAREIESCYRYPVVICDRSVLDNYAYLVYQIGTVPHLETLVGYWMSTYDLLFKVPILAPPRSDGVRDTDIEFQLGVDQVLDHLLHQKNIAALTLPLERRGDWMEECSLRAVEYWQARHGETARR